MADTHIPNPKYVPSPKYVLAMYAQLSGNM